MIKNDRSLAVMQPYFFPYIGYFQLIHAVDLFVFYDDVNFIKKGWINRNNILMNGNAKIFSVPLHKPSQNNRINETKISEEMFAGWRDKFLKSLEHNYKKAPFFQSTFDLVQHVLDSETDSISEFAITSVIETCEHIGHPIEYTISSEKYSETQSFERAERLKAISTIEQCSHYINALGGKVLYDKVDFQESNINLSFLNPTLTEYKQFNHDFVPGLSIIDVLMFNGPELSHNLLNGYTLE